MCGGNFCFESCNLRVLSDCVQLTLRRYFHDECKQCVVVQRTGHVVPYTYPSEQVIYSQSQPGVQKRINYRFSAPWQPKCSHDALWRHLGGTNSLGSTSVLSAVLSDYLNQTSHLHSEFMQYYLYSG